MRLRIQSNYDKLLETSQPSLREGVFMGYIFILVF